MSLRKSTKIDIASVIEEVFPVIFLWHFLFINECNIVSWVTVILWNLIWYRNIPGIAKCKNVIWGGPFQSGNLSCTRYGTLNRRCISLSLNYVTHFIVKVGALNNIEVKKRFEFLEVVAGIMDAHLRYFQQVYDISHIWHFFSILVLYFLKSVSLAGISSINSDGTFH